MTETEAQAPLRGLTNGEQVLHRAQTERCAADRLTFARDIAARVDNLLVELMQDS